MANCTLRYIIDTVEALVERYGTREPEELCELLDIQVLHDDLQQKLKGYFFCYPGVRALVYDENLVPLFVRILLAHELGHAMLHAELALMQSFYETDLPDFGMADPNEYEANLFAAELLLTDERVCEVLNEYPFFQAAAILNVPAALLDFKFNLMHAKGYQLTSLGYGRSDFMRQELGAYPTGDEGC